MNALGSYKPKQWLSIGEGEMTSGLGRGLGNTRKHHTGKPLLQEVCQRLPCAEHQCWVSLKPLWVDFEYTPFSEQCPDRYLSLILEFFPLV